MDREKEKSREKENAQKFTLLLNKEQRSDSVAMAYFAPLIAHRSPV